MHLCKKTDSNKKAISFALIINFVIIVMKIIKDLHNLVHSCLISSLTVKNVGIRIEGSGSESVGTCRFTARGARVDG